MKVSKRRASFAARYLRDVEALDLAGDLRGKRRRIEAGDAADAGFAGEDVGPGLGDADADRRNDAQAGDDYSALCAKIRRCHRACEGGVISDYPCDLM